MNQTLRNQSLPGTTTTEFDLGFYIGIYSMIVILYIITGFAGMYLLLAFAMTAARNMHNNMFRYVLGATMKFFDSTPVGKCVFDMAISCSTP